MKEMRLTSIFIVILGTSVAAFPAQVSDSQILRKREDTTTTLSDDIWTATVSSTISSITPYAFDGVTVSASPVKDATTAWVSLDSSGVPYAITPSVKGGKTTSASPTPTRTDYPSQLAAPPVLMCMNERVPSYIDPFCIKNETEFIVGETYWITWDPLYWDPHSMSKSNVTQAKIKVFPFPNDDDSKEITSSDWIDNDLGYYDWKISETDMKDDYESYAQIFLSPFVTDETDVIKLDHVAGPVVRIIKSKNAAKNTISRVPSDNSKTANSDNSEDSEDSEDSSSKDSKDSSKAKIIAPAVVVPIVGIALIAIVIFTFLWRKRNKELGKPSSIKMSFFSKGKGYVGSKKERMSGASSNGSDSYSRAEEGER